MLIGEMARTCLGRLLFSVLVILVLERLTSGGEHDSLNDPLRKKEYFIAKYQHAGNLVL